MNGYSVTQLAKLAGVSVRTLHLYDTIGLLKPSARTAARYRLYTEAELLRLQQILFYKELDFSLQEIKSILDEPGFNLVEALHQHKSALEARSNRMHALLQTIDKTILKLKGEINMSHEELYAGLPKEKAEAYRSEAIEKYGKKAVERSEAALRKMDKEAFKKLGAESEEIRRKLFSMLNDDPQSENVQQQIARHYANIRLFWGTAGSADPQAEAYAGLGRLYTEDERFTLMDGKAQPAFALFLCSAMQYFAETKLS